MTKARKRLPEWEGTTVPTGSRYAIASRSASRTREALLLESTE